MAVRLDRRQVKDLPTWIDRRNLNALREDLIQFQQGALEPVHLPVNFGERLKREPMLVEHRFPAVVAAPFARVGHDSLVLDRD